MKEMGKDGVVTTSGVGAGNGINTSSTSMPTSKEPSLEKGKGSPEMSNGKSRSKAKMGI